jgi:hypothetical protein
MWIKKIFNVNNINFEKVDKPKGAGSDNVDKVFFVKFRHFLMLFMLYGIFSLAIFKNKNTELLNRNF